IRLVLGRNGTVSQTEFIPYLRTEKGIRLMTVAAESAFFKEIEKRNEALKSPELLQQRWREFVLGRQHAMLSHLSGQPRILRVLIRRLGLTGWWYRRYDAGRSLNYVQCESH